MKNLLFNATCVLYRISDFSLNFFFIILIAVNKVSIHFRNFQLLKQDWNFINFSRMVKKVEPQINVISPDKFINGTNFFCNQQFVVI